MHALKEKYYQQFSKDLAQIVKYLSDLTSRRVSDKTVCADEHQRAFDLLKGHLIYLKGIWFT